MKFVVITFVAIACITNALDISRRSSSRTCILKDQQGDESICEDYRTADALMQLLDHEKPGRHGCTEKDAAAWLAKNCAQTAKRECLLNDVHDYKSICTEFSTPDALMKELDNEKPDRHGCTEKDAAAWLAKNCHHKTTSSPSKSPSKPSISSNCVLKTVKKGLCDQVGTADDIMKLLDHEKPGRHGCHQQDAEAWLALNCNK